MTQINEANNAPEVGYVYVLYYDGDKLTQSNYEDDIREELIYHFVNRTPYYDKKDWINETYSGIEFGYHASYDAADVLESMGDLDYVFEESIKESTELTYPDIGDIESYEYDSDYKIECCLTINGHIIPTDETFNGNQITLDNVTYEIIDNNGYEYEVKVIANREYSITVIEIRNGVPIVRTFNIANESRFIKCCAWLSNQRYLPLDLFQSDDNTTITVFKTIN